MISKILAKYVQVGDTISRQTGINYWVKITRTEVSEIYIWLYFQHEGKEVYTKKYLHTLVERKDLD